MINIIIAEDNKIVRKGTVDLLLNRQEDMLVIGEASNGLEALKLLRLGIYLTFYWQI